VKTAMGVMAAKRVHHLPVVQGSDILGLVTDRDIKLALAVGKGIGDASSLRVEDVCSTEPYIVDYATRLDEVLERMLDDRYGSVLVTKNGKLVGIFTMVNACRRLREMLAAAHPDA
jgi:acetoin utilization protein AcuB